LVAAALARWRSDLIDLTRRNPLLNLVPTPSWSLTISHPAALLVVDRLARTAKPWSFWMPPVVDEEGTAATAGLARIQTKANELVSGDLSRRDLVSVLTNLHERSRSEFLERGLRILHVACGFLEWREEDDGEPLRSPLVLVPVALERSSLRDAFTLEAVDEDPVVNPALQARLRQDFDFCLPPAPEKWDENTLTSFFAEVAGAVAGLPGWRVDSGADLALFPVFKAVMHRDLKENADRVAAHPLLRALAGEDTLVEELEPQQPAQKSYFVLDVDASQRPCLEAAARGHSFVLQGPPGTGKSQTIANLIADGLAAGKTVLFVSQRKTALDYVYQRLRAVGLGDFCLELHSPKTDARAVFADLGRCLGEKPGADAEVPAEEAEKLQERHKLLQAYLLELQVVREPLGQSAWWALGELARCAGLADIPLGLLDPADLTPDWLEQARGALRHLRQLWHIPEQGVDYPWWGFKADDRFTLKLRDEVTALVERIRGRLDRLATVAGEYAAKIGVQGSVPWLLRVADALESSPGPPASWLAAEDLPEIAADLERCAADYQQRGQSREPITARYGPEAWRLPDGTRANVEQSWHAVGPLLAPGDERGEGLLTQQQQLRGWAADTQRRIPGWLSEARTLEKWLGIALPRGAGATAGKEDPSVQVLRRLHRLAHLCVAENAPERSWILDPTILEQARKLVASNRPVFADFNKRRAALLERYTENLFELDLDGIAQRLAGPYRGWLRTFNMQFRRDRRAVRRRTRTVTLPATWWQDVPAARDVLRQQASLDAEQPARQAVLGRYEKSFATDFDAAERATRIAAEAVELAHELDCPSLSGRLLDALSSTTAPAEKNKAALKRLHDSLGAWQHATDELKAHLPTDKLPGSGVPLEESALSVLLDYARNLQAKLNQFAVAADPVLAHTRTPPADAVTLLSDLRQIEELRALEKTQEQDNARWARRLGPDFKGVSTDWKVLRKALTWTTRMRESFKTAARAGDALPEQLVKVAAGGATAAPSSRDLRHAKEQLDQVLHALEHRFEPPAPCWQGRRYTELAPEELRQRLETLRERVGELSDWVAWRHIGERFAQLGLSNFWEGLQKERPPRDRLTDVFTKAALGGWLESVFQQEPALAGFRIQDHEHNLTEYHDLNRRLLRLNAQCIAGLVANRRPQASQAASDPRIERLLHAARQDNRSWTVADLVKEMPELLQRLKPGALMSPLSVSDFLHPGKITFDLVVFDEAGLIRVEDAVGAIHRARQVVVAGDDQQGPVANFIEEEADDESTAGESLLKACMGAGLRQHVLGHVYRDPEEASAPVAALPADISKGKPQTAVVGK